MNDQFRKEWKSTNTEFTPCEWLSWIGQPMLYDGGLCVNRTREEHQENNEHTGSLLV